MTYGPWTIAWWIVRAKCHVWYVLPKPCLTVFELTARSAARSSYIERRRMIGEHPSEIAIPREHFMAYLRYRIKVGAPATAVFWGSVVRPI